MACDVGGQAKATIFVFLRSRTGQSSRPSLQLCSN